MIGNFRNKRWRLRLYGLIVISLLGIAQGWGLASEAQEPKDKPLIIIDPGHGGHDKGAQGAGGSVEKEVSLRFAEILAKMLQPEYRVALTRTGDYQVSLEKRASMANHQKAACFISLHVGGFPRVGVNAWGVYYFAPSDKPPGLSETAGDLSDSARARLNWRQIQAKYLQASKTLAETLKASLEKCPAIDGVQSAEAPLLALEGLDMPAVIVEMGYLTNPSCESRLSNPDFLAETAACLRRGIDQFFSGK